MELEEDEDDDDGSPPGAPPPTFGVDGRFLVLLGEGEDGAIFLNNNSKNSECSSLSMYE